MIQSILIQETVGDFTFWLSFSLRPNFRLRPNLIQKVTWCFWFGLSQSLGKNFHSVSLSPNLGLSDSLGET